MKNLATVLKEGLLNTPHSLNKGASTLFKNEYEIEDYLIYPGDDSNKTLSTPNFDNYFNAKQLVRDVQKKYGLDSSLDPYISPTYSKDDIEITKALMALLENSVALSYESDYIDTLTKFLTPGSKIETVKFNEPRSNRPAKWEISLTSRSAQPLVIDIFISKL